VKQDIEMLRAILPSTINIVLDINDNLPFVMTTSTTLNQVLMNLAINARDAMNSEGDLHISLSLTKNVNAMSFISHEIITGSWVELAVCDNGSGIDPTIINDIFTPFYTSKKVGEGTGMGLSVIYGIVKSSGGHILLESEVGKGTTFRVLFPHAINENQKVSESSLSLITQSTGSDKKVLIVDDEPELAFFIGEILSNYGYQNMVITNSEEALAAFQSEPDRYSIVITAQTMPKLSRIDLISHLRSIKPNFPAILCSGYSDKVGEKHTNSLNIGYFQKPINTKSLILKIEELLNRNETSEKNT